jgi:signal transduction histidine kinase
LILAVSVVPPVYGFARLWCRVSEAAKVGTESTSPGVSPLVDELLREDAAAFARRFAEAVEHEKLLALKEFAYGASHELNNPLANIAGRAQALLPGEADPSRRKALAAIAAQAMRAHEMISDLMLFAKPPALEIKQIDLADVVRRSVEQIKNQIWNRPHEIVFEANQAITIDGDTAHLTSVVMALLRNAVEVEGIEPRRIEVQLAENDGQQVTLTISDNGEGLSEARRARIFDPFYSGREAGRGLGFGLPKAWRIVQLHGGRIEVTSKCEGSDCGTSFAVVLPRTFSRE